MWNVLQICRIINIISLASCKVRVLEFRLPEIIFLTLYFSAALWMRTRNLGSRWVRSQSLATRHRAWASKRKCRKYVCAKGQQGTNWRSSNATLKSGWWFAWVVGHSRSGAAELGSERGRYPLLCLPLGNRLCLCIFLISALLGVVVSFVYCLFIFSVFAVRFAFLASCLIPSTSS